ncbi:hypothetical protein A0256_20490 [Mucilaginibacter sp. PAMC 26640]|nr:hypothetical protein A0256_20490 [Mucilaginibacter sp. PAMC 26640]
MKKLPLFAVCIILSANLFAQKSSKPTYTIAPWFNNKKAAVSLTFDDGIAGQYAVAVPLLDKYGFKGTFFMTVKIVDSQHISWMVIDRAAQEGHEIANHALTHPHFIKVSLDTVVTETVKSNLQMNKLVPSQQMITHAYPFGEGGGNTAKDSAIRKALLPHFIGARATKNKPYSYNTYDFAKTNDDYYHINSEMMADSSSMANFDNDIDQTIAVGGWFCPTYHGIRDGWIITPTAVFARHLAELDQRKNSVWIAPFKNVIQYHKERNSAALKFLHITPKKWVLSLTDTLGNNRKNWDQPLTINLTVSNRKILSITQKGKTLPFSVTGDKAIFNALPGNDEINVAFNK